MIRSMQKRHLLALLTVVLALFALVLLHPTASAADDRSDTLVGANIQNGVLLGYYGLGGDIVLPNTVTKIGNEALKGNDNIVSITIPGSVKEIGNNAFEGCTQLKRVIFTNPGQASGNLLIRISAFQNCKKLTECEIPARAYQVVGNVFKGCTSLTEVTVNKNNPYYFTDDCGVLFGPALVNYEPQYDDAYALQSYPAGRQGAYTIPSNVNGNGKEIDQIWTSGFEGASGLTDITIPDSIGRLGTAAFEGTGLTHVTIPDTVQQVDPAVFQNCTKLVSVKLPAGLAEIDQYMFANCISLQHVDMPDSITKINIYAFHNCTSLTSLALPKNLSSLSVGCFDKCINLQHVVVPPSVISFPKDELGVYNPFKYSPVTVYVQRGSNADRFFNSNLQELQAGTVSGGSLSVVPLNSVADPAAIDVGTLELIDAGKQVLVSGDFRIGSYLDVQPLTSGSAYNTFSAKANGKAFRAYSLALMPSGASASGPFSLTVGQPDGFSSSATLYDANGALPTDYADSSFTASLSALGPVALIDTKESTGSTEVTSVTLNKSALSLEVGKTGQLSATVLPNSATNKSVSWSSNNEAVATVSTNGTVTAHKAGTAVITARTANGKSASCTVTVTGGSTEPTEPVEPTNSVSASATLRTAGHSDGKPSFRLALKNAKNVATVRVQFTADTNLVSVTGTNGFTVLDQPKGSYADGKYTGEVMLVYVNSGRTAFTQSAETGIATFVTGGTTPTLKITGVTLSGWDSTGKAVYGTMGSIDPDEVKFVATTYDLSGDGKVDQLDITVAQAAYQARSSESDWNRPGANGVVPSTCDVTGDGVVDIQDLIAIYLNFTA